MLIGFQLVIVYVSIHFCSQTIYKCLGEETCNCVNIGSLTTYYSLSISVICLWLAGEASSRNNEYSTSLEKRGQCSSVGSSLHRLHSARYKETRISCSIVVPGAVQTVYVSPSIERFLLCLAAREMISIMQEYGEIVCCIGSSLNVDNLEIFNQADVR